MTIEKPQIVCAFSVRRYTSCKSHGPKPSSPSSVVREQVWKHMQAANGLFFCVQTGGFAGICVRLTTRFQVLQELDLTRQNVTIVKSSCSHWIGFEAFANVDRATSCPAEHPFVENPHTARFQIQLARHEDYESIIKLFSDHEIPVIVKGRSYPGIDNATALHSMVGLREQAKQSAHVQMRTRVSAGSQQPPTLNDELFKADIVTVSEDIKTFDVVRYSRCRTAAEESVACSHLLSQPQGASMRLLSQDTSMSQWARDNLIPRHWQHLVPTSGLVLTWSSTKDKLVLSRNNKKLHDFGPNFKVCYRGPNLLFKCQTRTVTMQYMLVMQPRSVQNLIELLKGKGHNPTYSPGPHAGVGKATSSTRVSSELISQKSDFFLPFSSEFQ